MNLTQRMKLLKHFGSLPPEPPPPLLVVPVSVLIVLLQPTCIQTLHASQAVCFIIVHVCASQFICMLKLAYIYLTYYNIGNLHKILHKTWWILHCKIQNSVLPGYRILWTLFINLYFFVYSLEFPKSIFFIIFCQYRSFVNIDWYRTAKLSDYNIHDI